MEMIKVFEEDKHRLGFDSMDTLHEEFLDIYNSVDLNSIENIKHVLTKLYHHTQNHFRIEEELMDKIHYPRTKEHKDEHSKVLAEMDYFLNLKSTIFGQNMIKAYYKEQLTHWFDLHLISMDSDLASCAKKEETL